MTYNGESYIDLTKASADVFPNIVNWKVSTEETLSVLKYITYEILREGTVRRQKFTKHMVDRARYRLQIREQIEVLEGEDMSVEELTALLQRAKSVATRRERVATNKTPYWWNIAIQKVWNKCNEARRRQVREHRASPVRRDRNAKELMMARRILKNEIR